MKTLDNYLRRFPQEQAAEMRRIMEINQIEFDSMSSSDLEDMELATNPSFIAAMLKLVEALKSTDFDFDKVEEVVSIE